MGYSLSYAIAAVTQFVLIVFVGLIVRESVRGLIGGFLASAVFGVDAMSGLNLVSVVVAFIGAVILVAILRAVAPGRARV